jgi:tRNA pseudouridine38-40 synthase
MSAKRNILLTIAYDGTNFSGWQRQPAARTVCGELEAVLSGICGVPIELNGASRTDAGVHALGQCASFSGEFGIPTQRICRAVNDALAKSRLERVGEIQVVSALEKPEGFHARYDSKGKRYIYKIKNAEKPDLFCRNYYYQIAKPLDVPAMQRAADYLTGERDFRCFMAAGGNEQKTTVREIFDCEISKTGDDVTLSVSGSGFLYNMVRIITGTLVETGLGKRSPDQMRQTLIGMDRSKAGHTAPPQGLYLKEVFY